MRSLPTIALCLCALLLPAAAQTCGPNSVLLINDNLPAVPPPVGLQVAIIQGLCEGEGCAAVFDVSSFGAPVKVNAASVGYFSPPPSGGLVATANLQYFDGITFDAAGVPTLGPPIFDLNQLGNSVQLTSSAINTFDTSGANAIVTSGKLVVAWTMNIQATAAGSCATGYSTNFATDATAPFPCTITPGKNLIKILGQGWRDSALASVATPFGNVPLCPFYLNGNWLIRACVEPVASVNPLSIAYSPSSPVSNGSVVFAGFSSDASFAGHTYLAAPAFAPALPGSPFPIPLDDPLTLAYLSGDPVIASFFTNFSGTLSATGNGGGIIGLPLLPPAALPFTLQVAFVTLDPGGALSGVSDAAALVIQ